MAKPVITPIAAAILVENNYFAPGAKDMLFREVEFPANDAHFLAGPFKHEGRFYGLATVRHEPEALAESAMLQKQSERCLVSLRHCAMPYPIAQIVHAQFGNSSEMHLYKDEASGKLWSYSDLDLKLGADEIADELKAKLTPYATRCSFFYKTEGARVAVEALLTAEQLEQWQSSLEVMTGQVIDEVKQTECCAERPYQIYLCGNDDSSWTTTRATMKDVEALFADIEKRGSAAVYDNMTFTN